MNKSSINNNREKKISLKENPQACSIVIRCYNEEKHIGKLLHGIMQQTIKNVEIIIVDSGSTDNTLKIARNYPTSIISISPEEFSFGRSLNVGISAAKNDYVVIASAHVFPYYRNWIETLLIPFENDKICLVYGRQEGNETTQFSELQIFRKWFPNESIPTQNHPFCNNANAAIRRELWEVFSYNESLTGLEDIEWANRTLKAGYKISYQASAVVAHLHNESSLQTFNRYRREAMALKNIFSDEKFDLLDFVKLYLKNVIGDYRQASVKNVFMQNMISIARFRLMQFWGTYCGFINSDNISVNLKKKLYYPNQIREKVGYTITEDLHAEMKIDYSSRKCIYDENN